MQVFSAVNKVCLEKADSDPEWKMKATALEIILIYDNQQPTRKKKKLHHHHQKTLSQSESGSKVFSLYAGS